MKKKPTKPNKKPSKRQEQLRTKESKKELLKELVKSLGNVTTACKKIGIDRTTYYDWIAKDKKFKAMVDAVPEIRLDHYEKQLNKLIDDGNVAAVIFALKSQGKKRGWIEKQEHEITGNQFQTVNIKIIKPKEDNGNKLEADTKADASIRDSKG